MCWTPQLVEFPCKWKNDDAPDLEELGIPGIYNEDNAHDGVVAIDVRSITRMNECSDPSKTVMDISGSITWTVCMPIKKVKEICRKCGVSVKKSEDILNEENHGM